MNKTERLILREISSRLLKISNVVLISSKSLTQQRVRILTSELSGALEWCDYAFDETRAYAKDTELANVRRCLDSFDKYLNEYIEGS